MNDDHVPTLEEIRRAGGDNANAARYEQNDSANFYALAAIFLVQLLDLSGPDANALLGFPQSGGTPPENRGVVDLWRTSDATEPVDLSESDEIDRF